ncbi:hypothetical protein CEXT_48191, partial [Caerostris extrusa]
MAPRFQKKILVTTTVLPNVSKEICSFNSRAQLVILLLPGVDFMTLHELQPADGYEHSTHGFSP